MSGKKIWRKACLLSALLVPVLHATTVVAAVSVTNGGFEDPGTWAEGNYWTWGTGQVNTVDVPVGWTLVTGMSTILHRPTDATGGLYAQPTDGSATLFGLECHSDFSNATGVYQDIGTLTAGKLYTFNGTLFSNIEGHASGYEISLYNVTDGRKLAAITQANYNPSTLGTNQTLGAKFSYAATAADNGDTLRLILAPKNDAVTYRTGVDAVSVTETNALLHQWTFNDGTAKDSVGTAHGTLYNGATISGGALNLDGVNDYMRTSAIGETITAKTLVAWMKSDNLTQKSGGVLTLENPTGDSSETFDSIVYAERTDNQWMSGSNGWERSNGTDNGGEAETSTDKIMVAISYADDGSISIYRNGDLYASYAATGPLSYDSNFADVLLGLRHEVLSSGTGTVDGDDAFWAGLIDEARIYGYAMNATEVGTLYASGPVVPEPSTLVILGTALAGLLAYAWRKRK